MALSSYVKPPPTALAYVRTQARRRIPAWLLGSFVRALSMAPKSICWLRSTGSNRRRHRPHACAPGRHAELLDQVQQRLPGQAQVPGRAAAVAAGALEGFRDQAA